jgi:PPM family protein phosphatase
VPGAADVRLSFAAVTDVGRKRAVNEDSFLAESPVFIVADGMGGHEAGDKASAAVVNEFKQLAARGSVTIDDVTRAVEGAHRAVQSVAEGTTRGAGSTLTGIVLVEHDGNAQWLVVNIGDSRVYRMLATDLMQLTVDHSVVQQLVAEGSLRPEEAATYVGRNVITRAVGSPDSPPDYWLHPVVTGERLLVCSDGLTGELGDETIRAGLTLGGATQQTADALLTQALENGGRDNVTLVIVDVVAGGRSLDDEASTASRFALDTHTVDTHTVDVRRNDTQEIPNRGGRKRS